MKFSPVVLTVSLLANAALAFVYFQQTPRVPRGSDTQSGPAPAPRAAIARESDVAAALRENPDFVEAAKSGDPRRMREALVRAGFPDPYVRDMVTFHINNSVTPERLALLRLQAAKPYWKTTPSEETLALQKTLRELDARNSALAKDVFDGKVPPHPLEAQNQQRRYRFLPADKIDAVIRIDHDYAELAAENRGAPTAESRERMQLLQREKRADLAQVLSPQELELYDLNVSPTAETMRRQLGLFQPTEQEFRGLFEVRREFDEKYSGMFGRPDPATLQQRASDLQAMNNQARALLGEERYNEYQRAQDYGYRAATEIVTHFNLPPANAVETYTLQQTILQQAQQIQRNAAADRTAAATQIAALLDHANSQLTRLLGPDGADAYKKTGGTWLRTLETSASRSGSTAPRPALRPTSGR